MAHALMTAFSENLLSADYGRAPFFAVLDGAQFRNLPKLLQDGEFVARSLYLDRGDNNPDQVITAPHMVWLDERSERGDGRPPSEVIPALTEIIGDGPAAVYWCCPMGGEALFRHLRGLNMVLFPKDHLEDWQEPEREADAPPPNSHTLVLFRHADANVIAQMLPSLDPPTLARLYGPATVIAGIPAPEWRRGPPYLWAPRSDQLPPATPGSLRLSGASLDAVAQAGEAASDERIAAYLREAAPVYTDRISDADLRARMDEARTAGEEAGLVGERAYGHMALLSLMTGGELMQDRMFIAGLRDDPRESDTALDEVLGQIADMDPADMEGFFP